FLACIALGLCFGLFTGLGIYTVCETTGIFDKLAASEYESIEEIVTDILEQNGSKTYMNVQSHGDAEVSSSGVAVTQPVQPSEDGVTAVVAEVMPAMVSIINTYVDEYSYFGQVVQQENSSSGSGIIVGENETELLIATNYHVVEKAKTLTVNFNDGSNAGAVVKGSDPDMDLAVIAVPLSTLKAETKSAIAIARLGDSNSLQLGQSVIAIGNALGYGQSVSGGYVSALNREISMEDGSTGTFIQTDAAINPGNSGGALLNMAGEVIGINSSKIGGSVVEGMGFAIPISAAQPILEELMTKKTRTELAENQGYIGIRLQTVTEYDAQRYGMPTGIYVYEAIEGLAAANAGIVRGDIITKFDGTRLSTSEQLMEMIKYYNVGEEVEVVVQRSVNGVYQEMVITLVLGEAPAQ
ncbi:MAG: trypsin-like peptidase domain-containing protein, partial [Agathobacter sp.]|nr:trypsin-like peptidase domain-containing protein [Agathobacter sp.]